MIADRKLDRSIAYPITAERVLTVAVLGVALSSMTFDDGLRLAIADFAPSAPIEAGRGRPRFGRLKWAEGQRPTPRFTQ
jgi:hypothetical protein